MTSTTPKQRQPKRRSSPWVATGRLFVTTASDSASVRFEWHHIDAENERVRLSGALNMGSLHLIRSQDQLINGKTGETWLCLQRAQHQPLKG